MVGQGGLNAGAAGYIRHTGWGERMLGGGWRWDKGGSGSLRGGLVGWDRTVWKGNDIEEQGQEGEWEAGEELMIE